MKLYYGKPYSVKDEFFRFVPSNSDVESGYIFPAKTVYVYDETKRENNVITAITVGEMETLTDNPSLKDKMLFVISYQNMRMVVVYKEY